MKKFILNLIILGIITGVLPVIILGIILKYKILIIPCILFIIYNIGKEM